LRFRAICLFGSVIPAVEDQGRTGCVGGLLCHPHRTQRLFLDPECK
jgi:hypothetical protein